MARFARRRWQVGAVVEQRLFDKLERIASGVSLNTMVRQTAKFFEMPRSRRP